MRIAFYAPLKAPDHPVPSGDRQMARLLIAALERAGHEVTIVSRLRTFLPAPDAERQTAIRQEARAETGRIARSWDNAGPPDLWFTYHNHHKAPDLLGFALADRFRLPYAMAEASHAPRRADAWGAWHAAAEEATRRADLHLCFTARDRDGIATLLRPDAVVADLPPFIDADVWPSVQRRGRSGPVTLITVAMMRSGDKLDSYRCLAAALALMPALDWRLVVVGDGPARPAVEAALSGLPSSRLRWCGVLSPGEVADELAAADVYVWPGFGEAFGLGYLEAQATGLPVVALDVAGVSSVVRHDVTGLLAREASPDALAETLALLCRDADLRARLGVEAAAWVRRERTLKAAARTLQPVIARLRAHVLHA